MPKFKRQNKTSIHYEIIESDDSRVETLLFLGGLTRDNTIWRKIIPLIKNEFKIIVPDNRDSGQSSQADTEYTISDLAEDMSDLIANLKEKPVHVIGHSMGGFMGIHLAAKYPDLVKTLVLCSTAEKQTNFAIQYLEERIRKIEDYVPGKATPANKEDIIAVMEKIYSVYTLKNKALVDEITNFEMSNPYPQSLASFKRQAFACIKHDAEHLLKYINCPTLIITGEEDKAFPPNIAYNLAKKINGARVAIISGAAHMIQIEKPSSLSDHIRNFILNNSVQNYVSTRPGARL